ncbi:P-loop containing nucleoside triphosphate hydrolase protein [Auriscalpium vulgare]|uniref:P-loop containing nucleoside triphosphate hydrolase protein n=1 Tax=Auriscalpium vulgare TaxID=40419 RepID=A0ACB8R6U2_9AGAM|nr:P-loop containing nucleoside triphosphate hydrolase protein [Auriscalpium vulgare]
MNRPQRFNAKARNSVAGSSHKKSSSRGKKASVVPDTNADVVALKSAEEKDVDRKEKLRQELLAQSESKASGKKRKRLDKYIKLKKDERLELFERLSKSQAELSSTLPLYSSSTLGAGKIATNQSRLDRLEDKEVRRIMDERQVAHASRNLKASGAATSDSEFETVDDAPPAPSRGSNAETEGFSKDRPVVIVDDSSTVNRKLDPTPASGVGSGLLRNSDGSAKSPRMLKRKAKGTSTILQRWKRTVATREPEEEEDSFDSSDSSDDSEEVEDSALGASLKDSSDSDSESKPPNAAQRFVPGELSTKRRAGNFKQWAVSQLSAVKDYVAPLPSEVDQADAEPDSTVLPLKKKRKLDPPVLSDMRGPLGEQLQVPSTSFTEHMQSSTTDGSNLIRVITVTRPGGIQDTRLLLPIVSEEQPIMEAILLNPVVVISGETGSGKTTQVPQFLFEAGFGSPGSDNPGMIGVTQPRRVAAMSMASRVAHELSLPSSRVSYQIRYDATISPSTSIKFMTDGVLLRELVTDFLLLRYSIIIIDEAHERSMNTDILIGVLSRVIKLREAMWKEGKDGIKPLRLIIMSATLRVADFAENRTLFFTPPPIITVPARQHPVTVHFNRRTNSDYVSEAIRKAMKIHTRLPPGGILIFLTGQNEILGVCKKLEEKYGAKALAVRNNKRKAGQEGTHANRFFQDATDTVTVKSTSVDVEAEDMELGNELSSEPFDLPDEESPDADVDALDTDDDESADEGITLDVEDSEVPMHIVPLYSLLESEKQMKVFQPPPPGARLVVVATNVAETSLTIPGIRYVVDCGRAKERQYNVANGIQSFQVSWISKASAAQRAGRAGRTGPGHCYRLYSSAIFEHHLAPFSQPEIHRMPIEGIVLHMKSMHIDSVVNFPFPTPPDRTSLRRAETVLAYLGALKASSADERHITDLGRAMSLFPLSPRFSRMLVNGRQHGCLPYVIAIVSAMSVGDPFLREDALRGSESSENESEDDLVHMKQHDIKARETRRALRRAYFQSQQVHGSLGSFSSDLFAILSVVGAYEYAGRDQGFCAEQFVRPKAMEEIHKLRAQISNIARINFPDLDPGFIPKLPPPSHQQLKVLRQLIAASFIDQVAARKELVDKDSASGNQYSTTKGVPYRALGIPEDVYIHPSSVLSSGSPPDYIVYTDIVRAKRIWLKGLTVVNPAWLALLGKESLCSFSKPFKNKSGEQMVITRFGPEGWELPPIRADAKG